MSLHRALTHLADAGDPAEAGKHLQAAAGILAATPIRLPDERDEAELLDAGVAGLHAAFSIVARGDDRTAVLAALECLAAVMDGLEDPGDRTHFRRCLVADVDAETRRRADALIAAARPPDAADAAASAPGEGSASDPSAGRPTPRDEALERELTRQVGAAVPNPYANESDGEDERRRKVAGVNVFLPTLVDLVRSTAWDSTVRDAARDLLGRFVAMLNGGEGEDENAAMLAVLALLLADGLGEGTGKIAWEAQSSALEAVADTATLAADSVLPRERLLAIVHALRANCTHAALPGMSNYVRWAAMRGLIAVLGVKSSAARRLDADALAAIRSTCEAALEDRNAEVRQLAADLFGALTTISVRLGHGQPAAVTRVAFSFANGLLMREGELMARHAGCLCVRALAKEASMVRLLDPAQAKIIVDALETVSRSGQLTLASSAVHSLSDFFLAFYLAEKRRRSTPRAEPAQPAADASLAPEAVAELFESRIYPHFLTMIDSGVAVRLETAGQCLATFALRQKYFIKPFLARPMLELLRQRFGASRQIRDMAIKLWTQVAEAFGDEAAFLRELTPRFLHSLLEDEAGGRKITFECLSILFRQENPLPVLMQPDTANDVFDCLFDGTVRRSSRKRSGGGKDEEEEEDAAKSGDSSSSASEDEADVSARASAFRAFCAYLALPSSPLRTNSDFHRRLCMELVPQLVESLCDRATDVVIAALDCVTTLLKHWLEMFTAAETLYMLVPPLVLLANSSVDELRLHSTPVVVSLFTNLHAALYTDSEIVEILDGSLHGRFGLVPEDNPDVDQRRAVARILGSMARVIVREGTLPAFSPDQMTSFLQLAAAGILHVDNARWPVIECNSILFLYALVTVPPPQSLGDGLIDEETDEDALAADFLDAPENESVLTRVLCSFLHSMTMNDHPFRRQRPTKSSSVDGMSPRADAPLTAMGERDCLPSDEHEQVPFEADRVDLTPVDRVMTRFLIMGRVAAAILPHVAGDIQRFFVRNVATLAGRLTAVNPDVYGSAVMMVLAFLVDAPELDTKLREQLQKCRNQVEMALSTPMDLNDPSEYEAQCLQQLNAFLRAKAWEGAPYKLKRDLLKKTQACAKASQTLPLQDVYKVAQSLCRRTGQTDVQQRRIKAMLLELLRMTRGDDAAHFFFDMADFLRGDRTAPFLRPTAAAVDDSADVFLALDASLFGEYSPTHVRSTILSISDSVWEAMPSEDMTRIDALTVIQAGLFADKDATASRLDLLAHSLTRPYSSPEMCMLVVGALFARVTSPPADERDDPDYPAVCRALAASLAALPEAMAFNREFFDVLIDLGAESRFRDLQDGVPVVHVCHACAALVRGLPFHFDANFVAVDTSFRQFLQLLANVWYGEAISLHIKASIASIFEALAACVAHDLASPSIHSLSAQLRCRLFLPAPDLDGGPLGPPA